MVAVSNGSFFRNIRTDPTDTASQQLSLVQSGQVFDEIEPIPKV